MSIDKSSFTDKIVDIIIAWSYDCSIIYRLEVEVWGEMSSFGGLRIGHCLVS